MTTLKCKECSGQVSDNAKFCPHCGVKYLNPKALSTVQKIFLFFIAVVCIPILITMNSEINRSGATATATAPATPDTPITADDEKIGGQWHQEAMDAWKVFNNGKDLPEEDLVLLLLHGTNANTSRYYAIACDKGSVNYCWTAGMNADSKHNKKLAEHFYKKGCDTDQNMNNCMYEVFDLLDTNQMEQAIEVYKKSCNSDGTLLCDSMHNDNVMSRGRKIKFKSMLERACTAGHAFSCGLLIQYGIRHKTPVSALISEADLLTARHQQDQKRRSWDGQYETADCNSVEECKVAGNRVGKTEKYNDKCIPFFAKACALGDGGRKISRKMSHDFSSSLIS